MESQTFKFKGREIKQFLIKRIWEDIRQELASDGYLVEGINMPKIDGLTLTTNRLKKAWKQTSSLLNTSEVEYGQKSEKWRASVFFSDVNQLWVILVWEKARPIRNEVRHELLHIWESFLGLKWGALTQKNNNANLTPIVDIIPSKN